MAISTPPIIEVERELRGRAARDKRRTSSDQAPRCRFRPGLQIIRDTINANWAVDVLDPAFALVFKAQVGVTKQLVADTPGHVDLAGLGQSFQPGCDIDAVAVNIPFIDDHIAGVNADAELYSPVGFS